MGNGFNYSQEGNLNKTNSNPIQGNKPMKKILNLFVAVCAIGFANSSQAGVQIVETMMMFKVNGVDTYRQGDRADWGTFYNPRLSVDGLGVSSFDPGAGNSLILDRVFLKTNHWNGGSTPDGGGSNDNWIPTTHSLGLNYSITPSGGGDSWQFIQAPNTVSGNIQEWNAAALNRNLLSGLSAGSYTFKYYFSVQYNSWTGSVVLGNTYDAAGVQGGAGNAPILANASSTSFNVIPEPSSSLLMGLGLASLAVLRRTRKTA
jgi:hypothetical protein